MTIRCVKTYIKTNSYLLKSVLSCKALGITIALTCAPFAIAKQPAQTFENIKSEHYLGHFAQDTSGEDGTKKQPKSDTGEIDIPQPNTHSLDAPQSNGADEQESEPEILSPVEADSTNSTENDDKLIENTNKPEPPAEVLSDLQKLPFPARKMHELILKAARSGNIENLRPFIGYGDDVTMLSLGGFDDDPIEFLKSISGDADGHELLAIITEILESDFVLIDEGTEREVYVWPYYFAYPLDKLSPQQRVQLFRLMTYGDYQEMEAFGAYIFYRIGITPEGRWRFFVAGD